MWITKSFYLLSKFNTQTTIYRNSLRYFSNKKYFEDEAEKEIRMRMMKGNFLDQ